MDNLTPTTFQTIDGNSVTIKIGPPANVDSFFVFSMHKSGSTLLNQMIATVCSFLEIPVVKPEVAEFKHGIQLGSLDKSAQSMFKPKGYCFAGFRNFPRYLQGFDLSGFKKLFLVRDPRDVLVSSYFSQKFSHPLPPGKLGTVMKRNRNDLADKSIDEYVLDNAPRFFGNYCEYEKSIFDENLNLFRYEDVVFEKERWLTECLQFLKISAPTDMIRAVARQFDRRPAIEDPHKHIRKVTPGDHKEKLRPETITQLNKIFNDVLMLYGYDTETKTESGKQPPRALNLNIHDATNRINSRLPVDLSKVTFLK